MTKQPVAKSAETSPLAVFRFGRVSAAVFPREIETRSRIAVIVYDVSLTRAFRGKDGAWQRTHTLDQRDIFHAAYALLKGEEFISEIQHGGRETVF